MPEPTEPLPQELYSLLEKSPAKFILVDFQKCEIRGKKDKVAKSPEMSKEVIGKQISDESA